MQDSSHWEANQKVDLVPHGVLVLPPRGCLAGGVHEGYQQRLADATVYKYCFPPRSTMTSRPHVSLVTNSRLLAKTQH